MRGLATEVVNQSEAVRVRVTTIFGMSCTLPGYWQAEWSHPQAISTSSLPAVLQKSLQYFSPSATTHTHGSCAHWRVFS